MIKMCPDLSLGEKRNSSFRLSKLTEKPNPLATLPMSHECSITPHYTYNLHLCSQQSYSYISSQEILHEVRITKIIIIVNTAQTQSKKHTNKNMIALFCNNIYENSLKPLHYFGIIYIISLAKLVHVLFSPASWNVKPPSPILQSK